MPIPAIEPYAVPKTFVMHLLCVTRKELEKLIAQGELKVLGQNWIDWTSVIAYLQRDGYFPPIVQSLLEELREERRGAAVLTLVPSSSRPTSAK